MSNERRPGEGGEISHPGIPGASNSWFPSQGHARRAALAAANQLGPGYSIGHDSRPVHGLPHYHVIDPNRRRVSGHFFYGRRPPRRVYRGRPGREAEFEAELAQAADTLGEDSEAMFGWIRRGLGRLRGRLGGGRGGAALPALPPPEPAQPGVGGPYRTGPRRAEIQHQIAQTQQAVAQASRDRDSAATAAARAQQAFETIRHPIPGAVLDLDRQMIILDRRDQTRRRLRQAEVRLSQLRAELQRLQEILTTTPEGEAMLRRPRGRPRPARGAGIVTLYHYSPVVIRSTISPGSFWTDFGGRNPQDVARITGRDPAALRYRYALRLTRADRNRLFRNMATVMRPGLPAADEYRNRQAIPMSWIQSMQPIQ